MTDDNEDMLIRALDSIAHSLRFLVAVLMTPTTLSPEQAQEWRARVHTQADRLYDEEPA